MKPQKSIKLVLHIAIVALAAITFLRAFSGGATAYTVQAAPLRQIPIYTPTPGPDGRIIYIVKANDTLLGISLTYGITVDKLKELNNLTSDQIREGQQLLFGLGGPAEITPTSGPAPTSTPILPTPSPKPGIGTLCILLFNDVNGDSIRQDTEVSIPNGAVSFGNRSGTVSRAFDTQPGDQHQCFDNLPEGSYTISVAVPEGYNPTTDTDISADIQALDKFYVNFGAQANSQTQASSPAIAPSQGGGKSPLLGIIGGLFLLTGVVFAIFAGRLLRRS